MKRTLIRYKTKAGRAGENQRLIEGVFQELQAKSPDGVRYLALRLGDDTFVHLVEAEEDTGSIAALGAFRAFQDGIKERCLELPQSADATVVGNYRMLGK